MHYSASRDFWFLREIIVVHISDNTIVKQKTVLTSKMASTYNTTQTL